MGKPDFFANTFFAKSIVFDKNVIFKGLIWTPFLMQKSNIEAKIFYVLPKITVTVSLESGEIVNNSVRICLIHCINLCPVPAEVV